MSHILFVAPTLEPGCSGVGDYTRRLAEESVLQGNCCSLAAVHDNFVESAIATSERGISTLRLPTNMAWDQRLSALRDFVIEHPASLISLQFVTYGYHSRGLPFGLARALQTLAGAVRFQIMFHELWCGGGGARW